jgi:hypothetical protein
VLLNQKIIVAIMLIVVSPLAWSQGSYRFGNDERAGNWETALQLAYLSSESVSGSGGSGIDISDDWGIGIVFGYNFTNHLSAGFEMNYLTPRYDATFVPDDGMGNPGTPQTINHKLTIFNGQFKGTYNILKGPITPFVDVSLGWTYVDSNVTDGPPVTGCWWDPWWGYVCRNFYSTYNDTGFSYGGAVGMRWDMVQWQATRNMFLRGSYGILKTDFGGGSGDPSLDMGRIEFGWLF